MQSQILSTPRYSARFTIFLWPNEDEFEVFATFAEFEGVNFLCARTFALTPHLYTWMHRHLQDAWLKHEIDARAESHRAICYEVAR